MKEYIYAVDVGGTDIKAGIIDTSGNILASSKVKTSAFDKDLTLANQIYDLLKELEKASSLSVDDAVGIGIGLPGLIDTKNGNIRYSANLNISEYPIVRELKKLINVPIKIANDADVATLAELHFGAGKGTNNFIMVTVGTGIGGGIVIDGKPLSRSRDYTGEIGHFKITDKKIMCGCGQMGCSEAYGSTRSLIALTKEAMKKNKDSLMWTKYNLDNISGKTVFEFKDVDNAAKGVFEEYIKRLGTIIVNLSNILLPELIVISGAISQQKSTLTRPLEQYVNSHIFAGHIKYKIKIKTAVHTKDAGIIGASCLFKEE